MKRNRISCMICMIWVCLCSASEEQAFTSPKTAQDIRRGLPFPFNSWLLQLLQCRMFTPIIPCLLVRARPTLRLLECVCVCVCVCVVAFIHMSLWFRVARKAFSVKCLSFITRPRRWITESAETCRRTWQHLHACICPNTHAHTHT